jgi:hypothetical protein
LRRDDGGDKKSDSDDKKSDGDDKKDIKVDDSKRDKKTTIPYIYKKDDKLPDNS